jgi:hypothetical protein
VFFKNKDAKQGQYCKCKILANCGKTKTAEEGISVPSPSQSLPFIFNKKIALTGPNLENAHPTATTCILPGLPHKLLPQPVRNFEV